MRRSGAAILAGAALVLAACGGTAAQAAKPAAPSRTAAATAGSARPYLLYTHCGIDEARVGNRYYEAVHPLSDGHGDPPAGWGNPYQRGTMTLLSPDRVPRRCRSPGAVPAAGRRQVLPARMRLSAHLGRNGSPGGRDRPRPPGRPTERPSRPS